MATLLEQLYKHEKRILETSALALDSHHKAAPDFLGHALSSLLLKIRQSNSHDLAELLARQIQGGALPSGQVIALLLQLTSVIRQTIFKTSPNKRAAELGSSAIDRLVVNALTELDTIFATLVHAPPLPQKSPSEKKSLIEESISEVLAQAAPTTTMMLAAFCPNPNARTELESLLKTRGDALQSPLLPHYLAWPIDHIESVTALGDLLRHIVSWLQQSGAQSAVYIVHPNEFEAQLGLQALIEVLYHLTPGLIALSHSLRPMVPKDIASQVGPKDSIDTIHCRSAFFSDKLSQAALLTTPPFLGRREERRKVEHFLGEGEDVAALSLIGAVGSGRRRLLEAALDAQGVPGARTIVLQAHPLAQVPMFPVITLIRTLLGLKTRELTIKSITRRMRALLSDCGDSELHAMVETLHVLLGLQTDDGDHELKVLPRASAVAFISSQLLDAVASRIPQLPIVLVIDAPENIDEGSRRVLKHLATRYSGKAPLKFVLISQNAQHHDSLFAVPSTKLVLGPLSTDLWMVMLRHILDDDQAATLLLEALSDDQELTPLALIQWTRYLLESGRLYRHAGHFHSAEKLEAPKHDGPGPYQARLALLPESLKRRMLMAAWIDPENRRAFLESFRPKSLKADLLLLEQLDLLVSHDTDDISFKHNEIRRAAKSISLQSKDEVRAQAHRFNLQHDPNFEKRSPLVSLAYDTFDSDEQKQQVLARAIHRALDLGDKSGASLLCRPQLETAPSQSELHTALLFALERYCYAAKLVGPQKRFLDILEAKNQQTKLSQSDEQDLALRRLRFEVINGSAAAAIELANGAIKNDHGVASWAGQISRLKALAFFRLRDTNGASAASGESLKYFEEAKNPQGVAAVHHMLGMFCLDTGALDRADKHLSAAIAVRTPLQDPEIYAALSEALAQVELHRLRGENAFTHLEQAQEIRHNFGLTTAGCEILLAQTMLLLNDPKGTIRYAESALRSLPAKASAAAVEARLILAQARHESGDTQKARAQLQEARKHTQNHLILALRADTAWAKLSLETKSKKPKKNALDVLMEVERRSEALGARRYGLEATFVRAQLLMQLGDRDMAKELAQKVRMSLHQKLPVGVDAKAWERQLALLLD